MAVVGIVPAGGSGERLGADRPKAFVALAGRPLLDWSVDVLSSICDRVVVAVPAGYGAPPDRVLGGASRSESVRAALACAPEAALAVVHDAARPLLTAELVERCIAAMRDEDLAGVIAAAPVTDTIKEVAGGGAAQRVIGTLDRSTLWAVQTPQVFRAGALRRALDVDEATLAAATDDSSLVEAAGGTIAVVESSPENLKITTALDLELAEMLLASRARPATGPVGAGVSQRSGQPC